MKHLRLAAQVLALSAFGSFCSFARGRLFPMQRDVEGVVMVLGGIGAFGVFAIVLSLPWRRSLHRTLAAAGLVACVIGVASGVAHVAAWRTALAVVALAGQFGSFGAALWTMIRHRRAARADQGAAR